MRAAMWYMYCCPMFWDVLEPMFHGFSAIGTHSALAVMQGDASLLWLLAVCRFPDGLSGTAAKTHCSTT